MQINKFIPLFSASMKHARMCAPYLPNKEPEGGHSCLLICMSSLFQACHVLYRQPMRDLLWLSARSPTCRLASNPSRAHHGHDRSRQVLQPSQGPGYPENIIFIWPQQPGCFLCEGVVVALCVCIYVRPCVSVCLCGCDSVYVCLRVRFALFVCLLVCLLACVCVQLVLHVFCLFVGVVFVWLAPACP